MNSARTGLFWFALICAVFGLAVVTLLLFVGPARAHSWYESACCNERDCRSVDDGLVVEKPDGLHVQGFGLLSRTDPRIRWSRDDRDHLCVSPGAKLICVYRKPNGT